MKRAIPFLFVVLLATPAYADDTAEARKHFARGLELVDETAYGQAVTEFEKAYALKPNYAVLYNIGLAHAASGDAVRAVDTFERYLIEGGAQIPDGRRREVETELARQASRIATLDIEVTPAGAAVKVDGSPIGTSPLSASVRVAIGRHVVAATSDGYSPNESSIVVAGEEHANVKLELSAVLVPAAIAPNPIFVPIPPPPAEMPPKRSNHVVAITSLSIGAALGAATFGVGLWNSSRYQDWESTQHNIDETRTSLSMTTGKISQLAPRQADNDELIRSVHRSDHVTVALGVTSALFIAAGVVLWMVER